MSKVIVIGAGGVGTVVVHKLAQNSDVFTEILLASRTKSKCDAIARDVKQRYGVEVKTAAVDADNVPELVKLFNEFKPKIVINVALPYQDLTIMDARNLLTSVLPWACGDQPVPGATTPTTTPTSQ